MYRLGRALLMVSSFAFSCQCSSNSTTNNRVVIDAGVGADQACSDFAQANCAKRQSCTNLVQSVGAQVLEMFGNTTTCLEREKLACLGAVRAPRSGYAPANVERCVSAHAQWSCSDFLDNIPPEECAPIGNGENGAACAFDAQCKSGFCVGSRQKLCGVCGESPPAGSSCSESFCGRNQICIGGQCQTRVAPGGACDNTTAPCQAGLTCTGASGTTKTCQQALTNTTEACGGANPGCFVAAGLWCSGTSRSCVNIGYVGSGSACGTAADGTHTECEAGTCYTNSGLAAATELGTCAANAGDGEACDTVLGPACIVPARCITQDGGSHGTCVVPDGATCE